MKRKLLLLFFSACSLYGALELLSVLIAYIFLFCQSVSSYFPAEASSIGIIGGADGPTAIFITTTQQGSFMIPVLMLLMGIGGILWLRHKR